MLRLQVSRDFNVPLAEPEADHGGMPSSPSTKRQRTAESESASVGSLGEGGHGEGGGGGDSQAGAQVTVEVAAGIRVCQPELGDFLEWVGFSGFTVRSQQV